MIGIRGKQNCRHQTKTEMYKGKNYYNKYNFWTPVNKYLRVGPI